MATETEIKLSLSALAARQLPQQAMLSKVAPNRQLLVNTYYDTPDHGLRRDGVVVRHRRKGRQCLLTVKTAPVLAAGLARRSEWEVPSRSGEFDFSAVDSSSVRALLESVREQLQPSFITHFRRDSWLLEPRAGVRIEVALDRGWIEARGQRESIREVELELLAGAVSDLFEVAAALQASLPLHPEVSSKSERAYRLLVDLPLMAVKPLPVATEAGMPTVAAFRLIALACISHLQCNEKGVCQSDDPEFVHQARVAIRRLRSAIRLWQPLLPESFVARFDPRWQELATTLGDARNWDVFLAETLPMLGEAFPGARVIDLLSRHAARKCAASRKAARSALRSTDYSRLLIDFTAALLALPEAGSGLLAGFVSPCLEKRAKRVRQRATLGYDAAALHRLRVAFKQLRYAVEFFTPIVAGPALTRYHQSASGLQEVLGRLNDLAVASQLTAEALPASSSGVLVEWLAARTESLLPEFGELLHDFQCQPMPWKAL